MFKEDQLFDLLTFKIFFSFLTYIRQNSGVYHQIFVYIGMCITSVTIVFELLSESPKYDFHTNLSESAAQKT